MNLSSLLRLGLKHTSGHVADWLLQTTGLDFTRPLSFNANIEAHCNIRCRYCMCWRQEEYPNELSIPQWQDVLRNIKRFVGAFSISFTGGEPFLKPGFLDLMQWCREESIYAGVTTNGTHFSDANIRSLVAASPWNVNISCDSASAEINDYLRGKAGLLDEIAEGIRRLKQAAARTDHHFPIIIKPTVNERNFRGLPDLVNWAEEIGATSVNMQPMDRWTPETYDELWIEEGELWELKQVVEMLIEMKREGARILNQESSLRQMMNHFREEAPAAGERCSTQHFAIEANGDVRLCSCSAVMGNLLHDQASDIWRGPKAREFRLGGGCKCINLNTSAMQRSLYQKARMGVQLLAGSPR